MKKSLFLVAALVTTTAFAQSNVGVSGDIRMFADQTRSSVAPTVSTMKSDQSHLGFSVQEALGNGYGVRATVDTFVSPNSPTFSQFGDRQATLGLTSKFGSVDFGRKQTALNSVVEKADPFATRYGSTFGTIHNLQTARFDNGVFLETVSFNGLKAAYNYSSQPYAFAPKSAQGVAVSYAAKGIEAHYAGQFEKTTNAKTNLVGASYVVAPTKTVLGLDYSVSYAANGAPRQTGTTMSVAQKLDGRWGARGTYGWSEIDGVSDKTKAASLGLTYSLSKRTSLEAAFSNVNGVANVKSIGTGLVHAF